MSQEYPKHEKQGFGFTDAEVERYACIGNLWLELAYKSEIPVKSALYDRAWEILREKGLEAEIRLLLDGVRADRPVDFRSADWEIQHRKKMGFLMKLYRLLEENSVLDVLSPELTQAGYKRLDKKS